MGYPPDTLTLALDSAASFGCPISQHLGRFPSAFFAGTKGDSGFSGWYAISDPDVCNDFCYWDVEDEYTSTNTFDPHVVTSGAGSQWKCVLDSGEDLRKNIRKNSKFFDDGSGQFDYLRCNTKGPGERLVTFASLLAENVTFFVSIYALSVVLLFLVMKIVWGRERCIRWCFAEYSMIEGEALDTDDDFFFADDGEETLGRSDTYTLMVDGREDTDEQEQKYILREDRNRLTDVESYRSTKQRHPMILCRRLGIIVLVAGVNGIILASILISSVSIYELSGANLSKSASKITPACSDPSKVCVAGNKDVHRPSSLVSPSAPLPEPFTYVVASDAQLDWFDGESPSLGRRNVPIPCKEGDSCKTCTDKFGLYTNERLAEAVTNTVTSSSTSVSFVMNGDLTANFQPWERHQYSSLLHNIPGIKAYWPGLGNHDYENNDAMYGGDQWVGPKTCNAKHAIGYIKGGMCGDVPSFDSMKVVRYDAASLAYSWEEGRFHFVQVHYYPTYEVANIGIRNSVSWLENDLEIAAAANRTSVLFVHSAEMLDFPKVKTVLKGKNVAAIFAGHQHRCFMRKCEGVEVLREKVLKCKNGVSEDQEEVLKGEKCFPGYVAACGGDVHDSMSFFYMRNKDDSLVLPDTKLSLREPLESPPIFINRTDNSLLCKKRIIIKPDLTVSSEYPHSNREKIPIFWSGSSSFQTFLKADFLDDRIVVNAMTTVLSKGAAGRVQRYVDSENLPNAVYPFHEKSDLDEIVISLKEIL